MAQTIINNGDAGLAVRTALNNMFTELYALALGYSPIKLVGETANFQQAILGNVMVSQISLRATAGTATIRVGTTPNGVDIMSDTLIDSNQQLIQVQQYFALAGILYFTYTSGAATINARIDTLNNFN